MKIKDNTIVSKKELMSEVTKYQDYLETLRVKLEETEDSPTNGDRYRRIMKRLTENYWQLQAHLNALN
jgi:hypothetical protein